VQAGLHFLEFALVQTGGEVCPGPEALEALETAEAQARAAADARAPEDVEEDVQADEETSAAVLLPDRGDFGAEERFWKVASGEDSVTFVEDDEGVALFKLFSSVLVRGSGGGKNRLLTCPFWVRTVVPGDPLLCCALVVKAPSTHVKLLLGRLDPLAQVQKQRSADWAEVNGCLPAPQHKARAQAFLLRWSRDAQVRARAGRVKTERDETSSQVSQAASKAGSRTSKAAPAPRAAPARGTKRAPAAAPPTESPSKRSAPVPAVTTAEVAELHRLRAEVGFLKSSLDAARGQVVEVKAREDEGKRKIKELEEEGKRKIKELESQLARQRDRAEKAESERGKGPRPTPGTPDQNALNAQATAHLDYLKEACTALHSGLTTASHMVRQLQWTVSQTASSAPPDTSGSLQSVLDKYPLSAVWTAPPPR
jgi:chemotaxis protein histidine kinase CheA